MSLGNLGSNLSMKSLFDGAAEVKKRASRGMEELKEAAAKSKAFIESNMEAATSVTASPSKLPPSAADVDPADADMYVNLPVSSARKLRFYDNADLTEIIAGHLSEKMALAEENARLTSALESILEGGRDELKRRLADADAVVAAAERARRTEDGVNRVMLVAAQAELARLRDALDGAQRVADDAATAAAAAAAAVDANVDGWGDVEGWEAADDDVEAAENDVADAEVTGSSPASATKSHSSGSQTWASDAVLESRAAAAEARCAELERQLEAAKTIAAEEAEDAAESEDAVEAAAEEAEARLETVTRELTTKVRRLEAELEAAKTSVETVTETSVETDALRAKVRELEAAAEASRDEIRELEEKVGSTTTAREEMERRAESAERRVDDAEREKADAAANETAMVTLRDRLAEVAGELDDANQKLAEGSCRRGESHDRGEESRRRLRPMREAALEAAKSEAEEKFADEG